ncbi:BglG family transcription antiterminator [Helcococcus ovis]|uniref:BglG family transcription antiterminator n=2 Tax=Helcococcus ovis TaxID=72026 RepID=UPI0038B88D98
MFTYREIDILLLLMKNKYIKLEDLSIRLDVSTRTIIRDIYNINLLGKKFDYNLESTDKGYTLNFNIEDSEKKLRTHLVSSKLKNINKKIFLLILSNSNMKIYDLAEILFESESGINNKLSILKKAVLKYDIELKYTSTNGFKIVAEEIDLRRYLLENYMIIKDNIFYGTLFNLIDESVIEKLKNIVKQELINSNLIITDGDFSNLISLIVVSIFRNGKINKFEYIKDKEVFINIFNSIEKKLNIKLGQNEIRYIIKNSIFSNVINQDDLNNGIKKIIENSLKRLKETSLNEYVFDTKFYDSIFSHLRLLIKRNLDKKNNIINPLLTELKKKYIIEISDAYIIKEEIYKEFHINISEDEIGYLAIYLGASKKNNERKNSAIIICNYGIGTSKVVEMKIKEKYKSINVIGNYPLSYLDLAIAQKPDFIISTVEILQNTKGIPIVDASKILYDEEVLNFNIVEDNTLENILYENLFFEINVNTKEEFFYVSRNLILKNFDVNEKVLDIVYEHESIVSTEIGNLVAIPHAIAKGDFKSFIGIFKLNKQILWNTEKVQFVFYILLNEKEKKYIKSLGNLYEYILQPNNISKMKNLYNLKDFIKEIRK